MPADNAILAGPWRLLYWDHPSGQGEQIRVEHPRSNTLALDLTHPRWAAGAYAFRDQGRFLDLTLLDTQTGASVRGVLDMTSGRWRDQHGRVLEFPAFRDLFCDSPSLEFPAGLVNPPAPTRPEVPAHPELERFLTLAQRRGVGHEGTTAITLALAVASRSMTPEAAAGKLADSCRTLGTLGAPAASADAGAHTASSSRAPNDVLFAPVADADGSQRIDASVWNLDFLLLSTRGTRWDAWAIDRFENGFTLHLTHADDPAELRRLTVWPPRQASLATFAQAAPVRDVQEALRHLDHEVRARTPAPCPPPPERWASLFARADEADRYAAQRAASQRPWFRADEPPPPPPPPSAFRVESEPGFRLVRIADASTTASTTASPVFDLTGSAWRVDHRLDAAPPAWRLTLTHPDDPAITGALTLHPGAGTGTIDDGPSDVPLPRLAEVVRMASLILNPRACAECLHAAARPRAPGVLATILLARGVRLQLWAGDPDAAAPFVQPVLLDARGRALLDTRPTCWGAIVRAADGADAFDLRPLHRNANTRAEGDPAWLHVHLPSRRVRVDGGLLPITRVAELLRDCADARTLAERLAEDLARAAPLPHPSPEAPADRVVLSADGVWRALLNRTDRTETASNGVTHPLYRLRLVRCATGECTFDSSRINAVARLLNYEGTSIRLDRAGDWWTCIDLSTSTWWDENFREPISATTPLDQLTT